MSYRKQILTELINKGNYTYNSMFGDSIPLSKNCGYAYDKLEYVPDENQKKMLDNIDVLIKDTSGKGSFSKVLEVAAKRGYLAFKPYLIEHKYSNPDLVLKYNRFLHLFRDYHYQVSYTVKGIGEYSAASIRTDYLKQCFGDFKESRLLKILFYMNCINAGYGIDAFSKLMWESPEVLDNFMKASTKYIFSDYDVTFKDLQNLVSEDPTVFEEKPEVIYRVPKSNTMDVCRLYVYSNRKLRVEFMKNGDFHNLVFTLPDWKEGLPKDLVQPEDEEEQEFLQEFDSEIYANKRVFEQFVCFALNYAGVVVNYVAVYSQELNEPIKALNDPAVKTLCSLSSVE